MSVEMLASKFISEQDVWRWWLTEPYFR